MSGIASRRDVEGAEWADVYASDASYLQDLVNASIHALLTTFPEAHNRYGTSPKTSFGRVLIEITHPSSMDSYLGMGVPFPNPRQVAPNRKANILFIPLEEVQKEIYEAMFQVSSFSLEEMKLPVAASCGVSKN